MKIVSRIALGIVLVLGTLVAVSNNEAVELRLWPLDHGAVMPLYLLIVLLLLIGVLIGLTVGWVAGHRHRKLARERRREVERLERDVAQLRADIAARDRAHKDIQGPKEQPVAEVRALERQQALVDPEGMDPARARG